MLPRRIRDLEGRQQTLQGDSQRPMRVALPDWLGDDVAAATADAYARLPDGGAGYTLFILPSPEQDETDQHAHTTAWLRVAHRDE